MPAGPSIWQGRLGRDLPWLAAIAAPAVVYVAFVAHFAVNALFWDDWTVVPLANAAVHGHLTIGQLWQQHNENRLLLPYLVLSAFGRFDHLNLRAVMFVDALVYACTWLAFVHLYRRYAGRRLGIVPALLVGFVWFGFQDWENALWGFQLAWFLIVGLLMLMLLALSVRRLGPHHVALAGACAFAASVSSLQGLLLWPIGLLCLGWRIGRGTRLASYSGAWVAAAVVSIAVYFDGFNFQLSGAGSGAVSYGFHHLSQAVRYTLVEIGSAAAPEHLGLGVMQALGALVMVAAAASGVACLVRTRRPARAVPLPAALIAYGLCFDAMTAIGRVRLGIGEATSSRYTMANILVLVGIAAEVLAFFAAGRFADACLPGRGVLARHSALVAAPAAILMGLLALQAASADSSAWSAAASVRTERELDARVTVNLRQPLLAAQSSLVNDYVYPSSDWWFLETLTEARVDGFAELWPPVASGYQRLGFPQARTVASHPRPSTRMAALDRIGWARLG
jgi:hypothetical protein